MDLHILPIAMASTPAWIYLPLFAEYANCWHPTIIFVT